MAEGLYVYTHVNANAATQILAAYGAALLGSVCINTAGATGNILTIFDAATAADCTAANTVAVINTTGTAPAFQAFDIVLKRGLAYTLATGTAADLTIIWR